MWVRIDMYLRSLYLNTMGFFYSRGGGVRFSPSDYTYIDLDTSLPLLGFNGLNPKNFLFTNFGLFYIKIRQLF